MCPTLEPCDEEISADEVNFVTLAGASERSLSMHYDSCHQSVSVMAREDHIDELYTG